MFLKTVAECLTPEPGESVDLNGRHVAENRPSAARVAENRDSDDAESPFGFKCLALTGESFSLDLKAISSGLR